MSTSSLQRDSAVVLVDGPSEAVEGSTFRYSANISGSWWIVNGPNGGFIAAVVARAVMAAAGSPRRGLRTLHVQYLRRPAEGPCEVTVEVIRAGRSVSFVRCAVTQDGRGLVSATASLAEAFDAPSFDEIDPAAFEGWPAAEDLLPNTITGPFEIPMHQHYDYRSCVSGPMTVGGWLRFRDDDALDECGLIAMTDAWWPPVIAEGHRFDRPMGVPTIDLTIHLRRRPPAGTNWVQAVYSSPLAEDGYLTERAQLWVPGVGLVAESIQLAILR